MTEAKWWSAPDSAWLLDWLLSERRPTERKLRLFALACCRQIDPLLPDPALIGPQAARAGQVLADLLQPLLVLIESMTDGPVDLAELERLRRAVLANMRTFSGGTSQRWQASNAVLAASSPVNEPEPLYQTWMYHHERRLLYGRYAKITSEATFCAHASGAKADVLARQVQFLHDLFGPLPLRAVAIEPQWLTSDVQLLARGIYEERAFDRMPILADALQDAGCYDEDVLTHCRAEAEHVRGCWVIDLLLGRPWCEPQ